MTEEVKVEEWKPDGPGDLKGALKEARARIRELTQEVERLRSSPADPATRASVLSVALGLAELSLDGEGALTPDRVKSAFDEMMTHLVERWGA